MSGRPHVYLLCVQAESSTKFYEATCPSPVDVIMSMHAFGLLTEAAKGSDKCNNYCVKLGFDFQHDCIFSFIIFILSDDLNIFNLVISKQPLCHNI